MDLDPSVDRALLLSNIIAQAPRAREAYRVHTICVHAALRDEALDRLSSSFRQAVGATAPMGEGAAGIGDGGGGGNSVSDDLVHDGFSGGTSNSSGVTRLFSASGCDDRSRTIVNGRPAAAIALAASA